LVPKERVVVAIGGGCGNAIFLDFVAYLLRMNIFIQSQNNEKRYLLFENEEFTHFNPQFNPEFKLILFQSVHTKAEEMGRELIDKLLDFNKKYKFTNFEFHFREGVKDARWGENYFAQHLDISKISKVILSAAANIEASFKNILCNINLPEHKIIYH
jgi:hypothetical protein